MGGGVARHEHHVLVASLGVVGLGWWVLRGDARNRKGEDVAEAVTAEHEEAKAKTSSH